MIATKILHNGKERIKIEFPYNNIFISKLKQIDDAHCSKTHNAWHIPYTKIAFIKLKGLFPEIEYPIQKEEINNEAQIQTQERSGNEIDKITNDDLRIIVTAKTIFIHLPK